MSEPKPDLLLLGPPRRRVISALEPAFSVHVLEGLDDRGLTALAGRIRVMAVTGSIPNHEHSLGAQFMQRFPLLELVSIFGVGYDQIDARWAGSHGIIVTNTPGVLDDEVADTALGLLLCTVRELPQAMAYLQAGRWKQAPYPVTGTLRNRAVGMVGMGRIGQAIVRRLEPFGVSVVYHARHLNPHVGHRHYADLEKMARDVDTLVVIVPGGVQTRHLIDAGVLAALGPNGILINVARGSVVDQQALIDALAAKRLLAAGLDVYEDEPNVPDELVRLPNVVLLPHVGSATAHTRGLMEQLLIDNLLAWASGRGPLTPVAETPPLGSAPH